MKGKLKSKLGFLGYIAMAMLITFTMTVCDIDSGGLPKTPTVPNPIVPNSPGDTPGQSTGIYTATKNGATYTLTVNPPPPQRK